MILFIKRSLQAKDSLITRPFSVHDNVLHLFFGSWHFPYYSLGTIFNVFSGDTVFGRVRTHHLRIAGFWHVRQNKIVAVLIKDHLSRYPKPSSAWRTQKPEKNTKVRITCIWTKKWISHKKQKQIWIKDRKRICLGFIDFSQKIYPISSCSRGL